MRLLLSLSAAAVLAVLTLAACNSSETKGNKVLGNSGASSSASSAATPGHIAPSDGVKRVTTIELRDALAKGTAIVIDVRGDAAYKQNHIKGSISIPGDQVEAHLKDLPRDKMIVAYCSWPAEHSSARAVQTLKANGIENAAALLGGTQAWQNAGLPMETGQ
jgi:rhodanese-related sulfurtransferase